MENTNENTNTNVELEEGQQQVEEVKTYTQEEVMKLLQSEADKRVTQALAKQKKEYDKQLSLSRLDERQRETAEKDMRIQELTEKLAQYEIEKNRSELKSVLSSRGLSAEFADIIQIGEDMEEAQQHIEKLDKLFKEAVNAEVKRRISSTTPNMGTNTDRGELDKKKFSALSIAEQNRIYRENPELYKKLTQE